MAYFDNAATTFPKPEEVYSFMDSFYRNNGGNAGLGYVNGNNGLGNANWNIGSRRSCRDQQHFRHVYPAPAWVTGNARSTERNCLKATGLVAKAFEDSADTKS